MKSLHELRFVKVFSLQKRYIFRDVEEYLRMVSTDCDAKVVVDIGAGRCPFRNRFDERNHYVALDITSLPNIDVRGNASTIPLISSCADLCLLIEVLEHVPNPDTVLKEINRIVKPQGYLIITIPLIIGVHDRADYHRFTDNAIVELLGANGFNTIKLAKRGGIFASLHGIISNIPRMSSTRFLRIVSTVVILPALLLLDGLDRMGIDNERAFTLGYDILAQKETRRP